MLRSFSLLAALALLLTPAALAQEAPPPTVNPTIEKMVEDVRADCLEEDVQTMVDFHTRHTLSDTTSDERGVGAARRWLKAEFERISDACGGCLDVRYQRTLVEVSETDRIPSDTYVYNVVAVQKGSEHPNRYFLMGGHLDSRVSNVMDSTSRAPGANDDASGVAGAVEAARVLSQHEFESSIVYVGYTGEEQGLFGSTHAAEVAQEEGWQLAGVLNNDMIGNIEGVDGVNFQYARKLTGVNVATLASLASGPPAPDSVRIGGAVSPSTTLAWDPVDHGDLAGYKVYWRRTARPRWQHSEFVLAGTTKHTLENIVIDNYLFGVAAVDEEGNESPVAFPSSLLR